MSEKEKMLAGKLYDPFDPELTKLREKAAELCQAYNAMSSNDPDRFTALARILGLEENKEQHCMLLGPVQFDYGCFTTIGQGSFINYNFTCLDCAPVKIGNHVLIGPNAAFYTPVHPMRWQERNTVFHEDGTMSAPEFARPITIEDNCWLGGNVTVVGGVTIGEGSVIGAGSVVTKDIPANSFAAGNPCRVIRQITEADSLENFPELY